MKKKIISILLALVMLASLMPAALAAGEGETPATVSVNFTAQKSGEFMLPPKMSESVSSDLAESYGYTDKVENGVSVLDVLVKVHELLYGSEFTKESALSYLQVSESDFVTTVFNKETSLFGFILNGAFANDGISGDYGYTGTTVNTQAVVDGDTVDFFLYTDEETYLDNIVWFTKNGKVIDNLTVKSSEEAAIGIMGLSYMWYGGNFKDAEEMHGSPLAKAVEYAQFAWVNILTGELTDIQGAVADKNGTVKITAPDTEGTYYLTAYVTAEDVADGVSPAVMQLLKITVDNSFVPVEIECELDALSVATFESNPSAVEMTPAFSKDVTEYAVAEIEYIEAAYMRLIYIKADAADRSMIVTASLNDAEWQNVTSGDAYWKSMGQLVPGENTLKVKVAESDAADAKSKIYTVKVKMKNKAEIKPQPEIGTVIDSVVARAMREKVYTGGSKEWWIADLAAYDKLNPEKAVLSTLTDAEKQDFVNFAIRNAGNNPGKAGELAKAIISLKALGIDASKLKRADGSDFNMVKLLTDMVDSEAETGKKNNVYSVYNLGYVLIALQQDESWADDAQINKLVDSAIAQNLGASSMGFDAVPPILMGIAPYYGSNAELKSKVDSVLSTELGAYICDTGAVSASKTPNKTTGKLVPDANSTGITLAGLSAIGKDYAAYAKNGNDMLDGLLELRNEAGDWFTRGGKENGMAAEQSLRGLLGVAGSKSGAYNIYDFSANGSAAAEEKTLGASVSFDLIPNDAKVTVKKNNKAVTAVSAGVYDLEAGEFTYSVTKSGYSSKSGSFEVTAEEAESHAAKTIKVSLTSNPSGKETVNVSVKVLTHDSSNCGGKLTYKKNKDKYTVELASKTWDIKKNSTVFDALEKTLSEAGVSYVERSYGYIDSIGDDAEFGHGSEKSGWLYMINGKVVETGCRDYKLTEDTEIIWFYTDDYTVEHGSESFPSGGGSSSSGGKTEEKKDDEKQPGDGAGLTVEVSFKDVSGHWALDAISYVYENGLMDGMGAETFRPNTSLSRSMMVTVLYRLAGEPEVDGEAAFEDVDSGAWYERAVAWAISAGIIDGVSDTRFDPSGEISREQLAVMLYRYAGSPSVPNLLLDFDDADEVSDWADYAVRWAVDEGLINGRSDSSIVPRGTATRAEAAAVLMRYASIK